MCATSAANLTRTTLRLLIAGREQGESISAVANVGRRQNGWQTGSLGTSTAPSGGRRAAESERQRVLAKRSNGEGSIYQRKDGRWSASLSLGRLKRKHFLGHSRADVA